MIFIVQHLSQVFIRRGSLTRNETDSGDSRVEFFPFSDLVELRFESDIDIRQENRS